MAINLYLRVSTLDQSFDQQMQDIKAYFHAHQLNIDDVTNIVSEHVSGGKSYEDRQFQKLLQKCAPGDYIYAASTDRLGRNFIDMMKLMEDAKNRGVIIVACKQNLSLDDDNSMAKIVLAVTAIMDEDERKRIKHRTANKKAWQREQIAKHGYFIIENGPNAGERCNYVGSPKFAEMSEAQKESILKAREESCRVATDSKIKWKEESAAYRWTMQQVASGKSRKEIVEEFNRLHELQPAVFCTRTGKPLTKATLSIWISEANPLTLVG